MTVNNFGTPLGSPIVIAEASMHNSLGHSDQMHSLINEEMLEAHSSSGQPTYDEEGAVNTGYSGGDGAGDYNYEDGVQNNGG